MNEYLIISKYRHDTVYKERKRGGEDRGRKINKKTQRARERDKEIERENNGG